METIKPWEMVVIPANAIARQFTTEKTGRELSEIVLPDKLPEYAPRCEGWHFYMPTSCVKEAAKGIRLYFPTAWKTIRFLSPYVKGQRSQIIEYPIDEALELLREVYAEK